MSRGELYAGLRELEGRAGRRSPFYMAKYVMGRAWMKDGKAWGWEAHHAELGSQMWNLYKSRNQRPWGTILKIEWSRDTRKSSMAGAWVVCVLLDNCDHRILLDSDKVENAEKKLFPIRSLFEDELFVELYGDLRGPTWTKGSITIKRNIRASDPSIFCGGLDAGKTSQHYTICVNDDTVTYENSQTEEGLMKAINNFELYESLMVKSVGIDGQVEGPMVVAPLTRWGFKDLGDKIDQLEDEDKKYGRPRRVYVSRKPAYHLKKVFNAEKQAEEMVDDEDRPMFPITLNKETLMMKQASMTEAMFSFNYLLRPMSKAMQKFQDEWFGTHNLVGSQLYDRWHVYGLVDPAGQAINPDGMKDWTSGNGGDKNALIVVAVNDLAEMAVLEYVNERLDRDELFEHIRRMQKAWPMCKGWVVEQRFKQYQLAAWLKLEASKPERAKGVQIRWLPYKPDKREKMERILDLQPYAKSHKILLRPGMDEMKKQFIRLGRPGEKDDLVDAFSLLVPVMVVPGHKTKEEIWDSRNWAQLAAKALERGEIQVEDIPNPEDVRTWQAVMREKKRMKGRSRSFLTKLTRQF